MHRVTMLKVAKDEQIDRASVAVWMRLARSFQKIDRRSAVAFRAHGLTVAQFDVIAQVGAREGCSQQQLADRLLVTKGNVCQLLDKMELKGWIERQPAHQGRGNVLYLTAEGRRLRASALPAQERHITRIFSALSGAERAELGRLLRKIERSLDERVTIDKEAS
jgi:DNA-binding MarR family transcriptional regulator